MLYCVQMDVNVPFGFDNEELEELKAKEKTRAEVLQRGLPAPVGPSLHPRLRSGGRQSWCS
jgi:hypothetical protein